MGLLQLVAASAQYSLVTEKMYDIFPWSVEAITVVLAIVIVFLTILCMVRSHSYGVQATDVLSLRTTDVDRVLNFNNLCAELKTVNDWHQLGINLLVPADDLIEIERNCQGNRRRKAEMLDLWLRRTPNAVWKDVVDALQQMGENRVAENIRQKYIRGGNLAAPSIEENSGTAEIAQRNKQTIDAKFAILLANICSKLAGREINTRKLRLFLRTFCPEKCIPESSDIHVIFEALSCNKLWDSWNYYPLEKIVEVFVADDTEVASWIEAYIKDLKSYKVSTKLIDHIAAVRSDSFVDESEDKSYDEQYYQKLSFKLKTNFTDQTMDYIDHLWKKVAELYGIPPHVAILDSIHDGCVLIVWHIPSHIAPQILNAAPPSDEFYIKHEITRVEYGGEGVYQEGEFAVSGSGLMSATTKEVSKFTVHTYDTHDQSTHVSAELKSLVDGSVVQATVVSQTPSIYELSYIPTTRGRHQLTVRVNNTKVGTFQVFVQHPLTQLGTPVRVIEGVQPMYIAVSDSGELLVTENMYSQYTVLDARGKRVLTIGKPPFGDEWTTGIATDDEGNVYVASYDHNVQKFNKHGEVVKSVGMKGRNFGEFDYPRGVRYHNHQLYVCDSNNGRVQVFDSNLNFVRAFGTCGDDLHQLGDPRDIDFDTQGNIYIVDSSKRQVLVFSEDHQYLHQFGKRGQGKGNIRNPYGLCVSGDYVYVTEWGNNNISVFRTSGEFVHSFGKKRSGRDEPYGIAMDYDGFIFLCDGGNGCIQVF